MRWGVCWILTSTHWGRTRTVHIYHTVYWISWATTANQSWMITTILSLTVHLDITAKLYKWYVYTGTCIYVDEFNVQSVIFHQFISTLHSVTVLFKTLWHAHAAFEKIISIDFQHFALRICKSIFVGHVYCITCL